MWKAGQIVTIKGKRYRIIKSERGWVRTCPYCDISNTMICDTLCKKPTQKVPDDCYLKELHPKSQEG